MTRDYSSSASWNSAAIAGFILAAVTVAAEILGQLCGKVGSFGGDVLGFFAWAAKMVLCALTFKMLLKRFYDSYDGVDHFSLKKYGLRLALFSSILVAGYSLLNMMVIHPDTMEQALQTYRETSASFTMLDSNSEAALEKVLPKLPLYTFFFTIGYCYLWGWLYSGLFTRDIAPLDPFAGFNDKPDNQ